jgi:hypothetical protein
MAVPLAAHRTSDDGVPKDTFGARLAIVRQTLGGWNVKRAAQHCGIDDQTWRNWEAGKNPPRDMEGVCRQIAKATGINYRWLMIGGPLSSPGYKSPFDLIDGTDDPQQLELSFFRPALTVVS